MPELPEVETVRGALARTIGGKTVMEAAALRGGLRCPMPADLAGASSGSGSPPWAGAARSSSCT